jgi:hypothetical protein
MGVLEWSSDAFIGYPAVQFLPASSSPVADFRNPVVRVEDERMG